MARGGNPNPSPATRIKKGEVRNPRGARAHNPELRAIKNLTKRELVDVGNLVVKGDLEALRRIAKTPGTPVITVMLAAVCVKVIEKGDMSALDVLLNRLIGKVKDEVEMIGDIAAPAQIVVTLPCNGREAKEE